MNPRQPVQRSVSPVRLGTTVVLLMAICLAGCGRSSPKTYPVTGKVHFPDGSPVMFGEIEFRSVDQGLIAQGKIARDGTFTVTTRGGGVGAVAGKHQVVINQVVVNHFNVHVVHDHGNLVDRRYSNYETTDLTVEVMPDHRANRPEIEVQEETDSDIP
jgi:hypothetical protein